MRLLHIKQTLTNSYSFIFNYSDELSWISYTYSVYWCPPLISVQEQDKDHNYNIITFKRRSFLTTTFTNGRPDGAFRCFFPSDEYSPTLLYFTFSSSYTLAFSLDIFFTLIICGQQFFRGSCIPCTLAIFLDRHLLLTFSYLIATYAFILIENWAIYNND